MSFFITGTTYIPGVGHCHTIEPIRDCGSKLAIDCEITYELFCDLQAELEMHNDEHGTSLTLREYMAGYQTRDVIETYDIIKNTSR